MNDDPNGSLSCSTDLILRAAEMEVVGGAEGLKYQCYFTLLNKTQQFMTIGFPG